jgi:hypothetical protein
MTAKEVTAKNWWTWFETAVEKSNCDRNSLFGKYDSRVKERCKSRGQAKGKDDNDKEWTAVMSIFLSDLAQGNKFHQRWEVAGPKKKGIGKIDFAWYRYEDEPGDKICNHPSVLIEHEQQRYGGKKKGLGWVAKKLAKANKEGGLPPLRVLITYRWKRSPKKSFDDEKLKELVHKELKKSVRRDGLYRRVPFLLVIGSDDREQDENDKSSQDEWHGYIWLRDGFGKRLNLRLPSPQGELSQKVRAIGDRHDRG